jgi:hypothetical protein
MSHQESDMKIICVEEDADGLATETPGLLSWAEAPC